MPPRPARTVSPFVYDRAPLLHDGRDGDEDEDYLDALPLKQRLKLRVERVLNQYLDYAAPIEHTSKRQNQNTWKRAHAFIKTVPELADRLHLWIIPFAVSAFILFLYMFVDFAFLHKLVADASNIHSDVAILMHNDLYGESSYRDTAAIVVFKARKQAASARECAYLGESLLQPTLVEDLEEILRYLAYADSALKDAKYWVGGKTGRKCHAIDQTGKTFVLDCKEKLPGLCSQRAPLAGSKEFDEDDRFHLRVPTGKNTSLIGYRDRRSFRFLGIRYAQQPRRFTHSTLYSGEEDELVVEHGSICAQSGQPGSEDCLFLNVWTPFLPLDPKSRNRLKPVIFWIHGGAFVAGSGSRSLIDGGNLASRGDVVVVSINYRLGTLGFLSYNGTANFGIGDQLNALRWVRQNIRHLGGDPNRITIIGQSAGASSVHALLGSPKARGNFSAAIMHSNAGGFGYAKPYSERYSLTAAYEEHTKPILLEMGCFDEEDPIDCLRHVDAQELVLMSHQHRFVVQDNDIIVAPDLVFQGANKMANVPMMIGTTAHDAVLFMEGPPQDGNLTAALQRAGLNAKAIEESGAYPRRKGDDRATAYGVMVDVATDNMFRCIAQATAAAAVKHDAVPSLWYFEFNRALGQYANFPQCRATPDTDHPYGNPDRPYYRCHSGDLVYIFGNMAGEHLEDRDGEDIKFSQYIIDFWSQFAWHHDPNPKLDYLEARGYTNTTLAIKSSDPWPPVKKGVDGLIMRSLQAQSADMPFQRQKQCEVVGFPYDYYG